LSEYFKRSIAASPRRHHPAFVGPFEELARELGVTEFADRDDSDFWERRLPAQMTELARELPEKDRFDAIIVDEAQDFADLWWRPLMASLRDETTGGLYIYSDENQRIFARFGQPPVPLVPLVLDHNLRNTRQIADSFASLTPMRMRTRGGEGVEVRFVPAAKAEAIDVANDEVETLLYAGWRPEHVALLSSWAARIAATHHRLTAPRAGRAPADVGAGRLLEVVLGHRGRVLRACPREQGSRAASRRSVRQLLRGCGPGPREALRRDVPRDGPAGGRGRA